MSIRLRLTVLYSAILAATLIVFSVALYFTVLQVTESAIKEALQAEAKRLVESPNFRGTAIGSDPRWKFSSRDIVVQLRGLDGAVLDSVNSTPDSPLPLETQCIEKIRRGEVCFDQEFVQGSLLLIYSKPIMQLSTGEKIGLLQIGRPFADQQQALDTLRSILIIGSGVIPLVAFGIGWALAGTAIRPINKISQTAQQIGAERDFGRRVEYKGPQDEVGRLAATFNTMLAELQESFRQVEQALQAQRRFVADASHELRTPLTTIRGNISLLQREPPIEEEDRVAVLTDMLGECERLIRLVNNLLALARADAGKPLRSEPIAIKPLIEDVSRQAQMLHPYRLICYDTLLDMTILGDEDALRQVLVILLDNALKFTPTDGRITITTGADSGSVTISVIDTGIGIDPAAIPHIFERFYRGDVSRTGEGAGLGLAIAKTLVEGQHGTLSVCSAVGEGSTFVVTLTQVSSASKGV
jgi:signal transduction histidine kinase